MRLKALTPAFLVLLTLSFQGAAQDYNYLKEPAAGITSLNGIEKPVMVKVIYDNYVKIEEMQADWGYSIVIEGLDKTILFDTGTKPDIFESNFKKMGINAGDIDILAISHEHGDHTGGIPAYVKMKTGIPVIFPASFSGQFKKKMKDYGFEPVLVSGPAKICENLFTSGEFEYQVPEQALVINTEKGLVVMTGCSHPGIVEMLKKVKKDFNKNIYMVFGGFHLLDKSEKEMNSLISGMKSLGIIKCGATHCTGDQQIKMIKEAFGEDYFELGTGNTFIIN